VFGIGEKGKGLLLSFKHLQKDFYFGEGKKEKIFYFFLNIHKGKRKKSFTLWRKSNK